MQWYFEVSHVWLAMDVHMVNVRAQWSGTQEASWLDGCNLKLKLLLIITWLSSSGEWAGCDWFSAITVTYLATLMEVAKARCSTTWQQFVFGLSLKWAQPTHTHSKCPSWSLQHATAGHHKHTTKLLFTHLKWTHDIRKALTDVTTTSFKWGCPKLYTMYSQLPIPTQPTESLL